MWNRDYIVLRAANSFSDCKIFKQMWLYCYTLIAPNTTGPGPVRGPEAFSQNKMAHESCHISRSVYLFLTSASCVPGMLFKIKQKDVQCHVGIIRKLAFSLWDILLGQKMVIWPIVILPFKKNVIWKSIESGSNPARDLSMSLFNCQEHNRKMPFHLSNIYQLGLGDCPRL